MEIMLVTENFCYRKALVCMFNNIHCVEPDEIALISGSEGKAGLSPSVVLIHLTDYNTLLRIIRLVKKNTNARIFIDYVWRSFGSSFFEGMGVHILPEKLFPVDLKRILESSQSYQCRGGLSVGVIKKFYFIGNLLSLLIKGISVKNVSTATQIDDKKISALKCQLAFQLRFAGMNSASEVRLLNLIYQLLIMNAGSL